MTWTIFIPGRLVNPLNGAWGHWSTQAAYRTGWHRATAAVLSHAAGWTRHEAAVPKRVTLRCRMWNRMDSDGLQAACKPIRDALVTAGVVSGDAERDGHQWAYEQVVDRACRGVRITVEWLTVEELEPPGGVGGAGSGL